MKVYSIRALGEAQGCGVFAAEDPGHLWELVDADRDPNIYEFAEISAGGVVWRPEPPASRDDVTEARDVRLIGGWLDILHDDRGEDALPAGQTIALLYRPLADHDQIANWREPHGEGAEAAQTLEQVRARLGITSPAITGSAPAPRGTPRH